MEKLLRKTSSNCCNGQEKLSLIINFSSGSRGGSLMAVCPNCQTKYCVEDIEKELQESEAVLCDISNNECRVVAEAS